MIIIYTIWLNDTLLDAEIFQHKICIFNECLITLIKTHKKFSRSTSVVLTDNLIIGILWPLDANVSFCVLYYNGYFSLTKGMGCGYLTYTESGVFYSLGWQLQLASIRLTVFYRP